MDVPDDDPSKLSEGTNEEAKEQPCEPKKEPEDTTVPGEGISRKESEGEFQFSPDSASPLEKDSIVAGSSSLPKAAPDIYIP